MQTREKIKHLRKQFGVSAQALADLIGISKATLYRYENGDIEKIPVHILEKIADVLDCSPLSLMENPVEGQTCSPIGDAFIERFEPTEPELTEDNSFYLHITGDCMYPMFIEGDVAQIHRQNYAESGSFAAVSIDGSDAIVQKVVFGANYCELHSVNPMYPVRRYEGVEMARVQVCGVVKELRRKF